MKKTKMLLVVCLVAALVLCLAFAGRAGGVIYSSAYHLPAITYRPVEAEEPEAITEENAEESEAEQPAEEIPAAETEEIPAEETEEIPAEESEEITEEISEDVTEEVTEEIPAEETEEIAEEIPAEETEEVPAEETEEVAEEVTEEISEGEIPAEESEEIAEEITEDVTEDIAEEISEEEVPAEESEEIAEEIPAEESEEVAEEITEEVSEEEIPAEESEEIPEEIPEEEIPEEEIPAEADEYITSGEAFVRRDADGLSDVLDTLPEGTKLTVLEETAEWYKVLLPDGTEGYVYRDDVADAEEAPVQTAKKVTIFTDRKSTVQPGDTITMTSKLEGFEDCASVTYYWMWNRGNGWEDIPGAHDETYSYTATIETLGYSWRLEVDFE